MAPAEALSADGPESPGPGGPAELAELPEEFDMVGYSRPAPSAAASPIAALVKPCRAVVEGRVSAVEIRPVERSTVLAAEIADSTGELTALFYGRSYIPGLDPGAMVRFRGQVGSRKGRAIMINPAYELLAPGTGGPAAT